MVPSEGGPPPGDGSPENSTRILAVTASIAAVVALAVGAGLLLRGGDDTDDAPAPATVSATAVAPTVTARTTAALTPAIPSFSAPNTSPLPTRPAHRVGEDCTVDGAPGRWDVVTGTGWVCVPANEGARPTTSPGGN